MTDDEYVKEFCSKCINRKGFDDVCEIRKNIKGELDVIIKIVLNIICGAEKELKCVKNGKI